MKIFISADIEGVANITHWNETDKAHYQEYDLCRREMTEEVKAACDGALLAGTTEIMIKDAHDTGRNLLLEELPEIVQVIRGWSGHPFSMVQELNSDFQAAIFIGYHSPAGSAGNPLAHTMSHTRIFEVKINGQRASEFLIHGYAAAYYGVPVVLVVGDEALCEHVHQINPHIYTVVTFKGVGNSTIARMPAVVHREIKLAAQRALEDDPSRALLKLPAEFEVEVTYHAHERAYSNSFYPGAKLVSENQVLFRASDYLEVLKFFHFCL